MSLRVAVVTPVAGRHDHLLAQHHSLRASLRTPDLAVVVAMGDDAVPGVVADGPLTMVCEVLHERVPAHAGLPLASARNRGAERAVEAGADVLVFLDVDCLAGEELVGRYLAAVESVPTQHPVLLAGPVAYLPPCPPGRATYAADDLAAARPHPARPAPRAGRLLREPDLRLFWSLSFATTVRSWQRIGGFDEAYLGYGAEDTDFAQQASCGGAQLWWVGGALAYHQWHAVSDPPIEHLHDVLENANRFHRKWGWFPMEGWLAAFQARGLAHHEVATGRWVPGP